MFQCSSASRKFLNDADFFISACEPSSFSALQRAENSSTAHGACGIAANRVFQCSSASRKFLNYNKTAESGIKPQSMFQCSSASRKFLNALSCRNWTLACKVSVLFSEPKIPQLGASLRLASRTLRFSALQRAENSSTSSEQWRQRGAIQVSVLFSEPKIPQLGSRVRR